MPGVVWSAAVWPSTEESDTQVQTGEFDPGSERTLAAGLTHASRAPFSKGAADG